MTYDKDVVKQAAAGRWGEIIFALAGIDLRISGGKPGPCQKCGGTDRFCTFPDFEQTGGALCRHCHAEKNGDGFATLQWLMGWSFGKAVEEVARYLKLPPSYNGAAENCQKPAGQNGKGAKDLDKQVLWSPKWFDHYQKFLETWCDLRRPVTPKAAHAFGVRYCHWPNAQSSYRCFGFVGRDLDGTTRAVLVYRIEGILFPATRKFKARKTHLVRGAKESWLWPGTVEALMAAEVIVKCEGLPDALALYSLGLPPRWTVLTNACGAKGGRNLDYSFAAGKRVIAIGDTDKPGQEGVQRFAARFIQAGATEVKLVRLPYEVTPDTGKDLRDWLSEGHTVEDFLALVAASEIVPPEQAAEWGNQPAGHGPRNTSSLSMTDEDRQALSRLNDMLKAEKLDVAAVFREETILTALAKLQLLDGAEFVAIKVQLKRDRSFPARDLNNLLKSKQRELGYAQCDQNLPDLRGEFNADRGSQVQPRLPVVEIFEEIKPLETTLREITEQFLQAGGYYCSGGNLCSVDQKGLSHIIKPSELIGRAAGTMSIMLVRLGKEGPESKYAPLPVNYASCYLESHEVHRFPRLDLYTDSPVYDSNWQLAEPAYNPSAFIYYAGEKICPANNLAVLTELLKQFCFAEAADHANFVGAMLDALLRNGFRGGRPIVFLLGNQPGLGKTLLAQILAVLRSGRPALTLTYTPDEAEFEKRIATQVRRGANLIVIDNAKSSARAPVIESCVLERSVTDPILSFRLLGSNTEIAVPNTIQFVVTVNNARLSPDLADRSLPVNLYYEGSPRRRKFEIPDIVDFVTEHRQPLLAELAGMVERWKEAGQPLADVDSRFRKWAGVVGGILKVANIEGFLENMARSFDACDSVVGEVAELVGRCLDFKNVSATRLVETCQQHEILAEALGHGSPRSKAVKLAGVLSRFIGERFRAPASEGGGQVEATIEMTIDSHTKTARYSFVRVTERIRV